MLDSRRLDFTALFQSRTQFAFTVSFRIIFLAFAIGLAAWLGSVSLMQALSRFDPERGFRFPAYAIWWIRAAIQDTNRRLGGEPLKHRDC
jgi:uncharacterized membrane protein